jgi:hypothetical protein
LRARGAGRAKCNPQKKARHGAGKAKGEKLMPDIDLIEAAEAKMALNRLVNKLRVRLDRADTILNNALTGKVESHELEFYYQKTAELNEAMEKCFVKLERLLNGEKLPLDLDLPVDHSWYLPDTEH